MRAVLAGLALLLLAAGCTEPRSRRCQDVCAREAECHRRVETDDNFGESECLDACAALERDVEAEAQVARHAACVFAATTCAEVLACP
jgi:hypothetical protein